MESNQGALIHNNFLFRDSRIQQAFPRLPLWTFPVRTATHLVLVITVETQTIPSTASTAVYIDDSTLVTYPKFRKSYHKQIFFSFSFPFPQEFPLYYYYAYEAKKYRADENIVDCLSKTQLYSRRCHV